MKEAIIKKLAPMVAAWSMLQTASKKGALAFVQSIASAFAPPKPVPFVLTVGPQVVPPGGVVTVQQMPQCYFQAYRLANIGDADDLSLIGMFVGNKPVFPIFTTDLSVKLYALDQPGDISTPPCPPSIYVTFQVKNTGSVERTFKMAVVGITVEKGY